MFVKREENIKSSPLETHKIKKLQFKTHLWSAKIDVIQKMASSKIEKWESKSYILLMSNGLKGALLTF